MSNADPNARPQPEPDPNEFDFTNGPPEEEFWEKYNNHLEFPLSTVAAVLIHVLVGAGIVFGLFKLMNRDRGEPVPLSLVEGGDDDFGAGSAGGGGEIDPIVKANNDPWKAAEALLPDPNKLPDVIKDIKDSINLDDPGENPAVSRANAPAYKDLDEELRKKMLGIGARKGSGPGAGSGTDNSKGTGPGGTGADSTRSRSLRWVLRFRTSDGYDYVAQLAAMNASIAVPVPPENKQLLFFSNLKNPRGVIAHDDDLKRFSNQIKFSDTRPDSVRGVSAALGVKDFTPRSFWAFFPKELEEELSRKETGYRNRRAEDIEETVFRVITRGGGYEIVVDDQTPKR